MFELTANLIPPTIVSALITIIANICFRYIDYKNSQRERLNKLENKIYFIEKNVDIDKIKSLIDGIENPSRLLINSGEEEFKKLKGATFNYHNEDTYFQVSSVDFDRGLHKLITLNSSVQIQNIMLSLTEINSINVDKREHISTLGIRTWYQVINDNTFQINCTTWDDNFIHAVKISWIAILLKK